MEEPKDLMVLGAIKNGKRKFGKILNATHMKAEELNSILEKLENRGMIQVKEKKGWLGKKIEITVTKKGVNETEQRVHELEEKWDKMHTLYKTGDKQKLQQYMDDNKSFFPTMMYFGIMDMMMFSMMFSMIDMTMSDYVPADSIPDGFDGAEGMDGGNDFGDGGFDIDIGF